MKKKDEILSEINIGLRLPIFKCSSLSEPQGKQVTKIDFHDRNKDYSLEIEHNILTTFDRRVLLSVEYLYLKQNPTFERDIVRTTYGEISVALGYQNNTNYEKIYTSLSKLQKVNINTTILIREDDGKIEEEKTQFNLLYYIKSKLSRNGQNNRIERVEIDKRKYDNLIEIRLNEFHIKNFRNKYYRILNYSLIKSLRSPISIRLFDYLNYKCYYFDGNRYKQIRKINLNYEDISKYLQIQKQNKLYLIKRQLRVPLEELKRKGVIKEYYLEKTLFDEVFLCLSLSKSINLWNRYNPSVKELDKIKLLTPLEQKLTEYGLTENQVKKIEQEYTEEYIQKKIEQVEYLIKKLPEKVKGIGRYLYNSIKENWNNVEYKKSTEEKTKNKEKNEKQKSNNQENEYSRYVREECIQYYEELSIDKREKLDKEVSNEVEKDEKYKTKILKPLGILEKRTKKIERILKIPSFEEWKKK